MDPAPAPWRQLPLIPAGYQLKRVRCGKRKCNSCPHGPYWYFAWREGARMKWKYVGKKLPADVTESGQKGGAAET